MLPHSSAVHDRDVESHAGLANGWVLILDSAEGGYIVNTLQMQGM